MLHLDFTAEIPGIEAKDNYEDITGPQLAVQGHTPCVAQQVAAACHIAGHTKSVTVTPSGVDDVDVSATVSVVDLTDDDLFVSGSPKSAKQESDEGSINHVSDEGVQFPWQ